MHSNRHTLRSFPALLLAFVASYATTSLADTWKVMQKVDIDDPDGITIEQKNANSGVQAINNIDLGDSDLLENPDETNTQYLNLHGRPLTLIQDQATSNSTQAVNRLKLGHQDRPKQRIEGISLLKLEQKGSDNVQAANLIESTVDLINAGQYVSVNSIEMSRAGTGGIQAINLIHAQQIQGANNTQEVHAPDGVVTSGTAPQWINAVEFSTAPTGTLIEQKVDANSVSVNIDSMTSGQDSTQGLNYVKKK